MRRRPSPSRCLVSHTCQGTHHFAASNNYLKRQRWREGGGRPGGGAADCGGWRVVLALCSVLRRCAAGGRVAGRLRVVATFDAAHVP